MRNSLLLGSLAALVLLLTGTAEALFTTSRLAGVPGRAPLRLDPDAARAQLAVLAVTIAVFWILGRSVRRSGAPAARAVRTGAAVGAVAGVVGGTLRAALLADTLDDLLGRYGAPEILPVALAVFVLAQLVASAAFGAAVSWLGWVLSRAATTGPSATSR